MRLALQVYDAPGGHLLGDWSSRAHDLTFETFRHGFLRLSGTIDLGVVAALEFYSKVSAPYIRLGTGGEIAWEGRIEDVSLLGGGVIQFNALGAWSALSDIPYMALWQDDGYGAWQRLTGDDNQDTAPNRFEMDNNQRLYCAPRKDESFDADHRAFWGYRTTGSGYDSARQIVEVVFSYEFYADADWHAVVERRSAGWSYVSREWTLAGDGTTQTGSTTLTFSGADTIVFGMHATLATAAAYTGETGDYYFKATSVVVRTQSGTVTPPDILADIVSYLHGKNPAQISGAAERIETNTLDVGTEVYASEWPSDIVARLARLGDNQDPPNRWSAAIWENRMLCYAQEGSGARTWYADIDELELERSITERHNAFYARYGGGDDYTAVATDDDLLVRMGFERRGVLRVTTSSEARAETFRDAALQDAARRKPRAQLRVRDIFDAGGTPVELWRIRATDTVSIRNLPPALGELDVLREFTLARTEYDCDLDQIRLIPDELPTLEFLVGRSQDT